MRTGAATATEAIYDSRDVSDVRPIGVFDSGVGGLTVLHECLVTMPNEDFVYLGDHARLPYGPRPLAEIRRFAHEIGLYLEAQGVKMIVVACNAATSAALPDLQQVALGAGARRDHARGVRGRPGDAEPPDRAARHAGDRDRAPLRDARPHARRGRSSSRPSRARSSCR